MEHACTDQNMEHACTDQNMEHACTDQNTVLLFFYVWQFEGCHKND
jgi:hypothetical protein